MFSLKVLKVLLKYKEVFSIIKGNCLLCPFSLLKYKNVKVVALIITSKVFNSFVFLCIYLII
jgi:hypothetical protein